jgi:hypothetical protein
MMQAPERKPALGVLFDSSMESVDQVLALAMLYGYVTAGEARLLSLSVSRNNLKVAAFCEVLARFYSGEQPGAAGPTRNTPTIGMSEIGSPDTNLPAMLSTVLTQTTPEGKPLYSRSIERMVDTADPVAQIRNALTAQVDQNAAIVLAGPPVNLLGLIALPGTKALIQKKSRMLVIAARLEDSAGFAKLLSEWPGPIVVVGGEFQFPGSAIEQDFAWAPNHPVVDAYRAANSMPYDAAANAMAAVLCTVHPDDTSFKLSEPGTVTVLPGGKLQLNPGSQGRHRLLLPDPEKSEQAVQMFRKMASSKPPERRTGPRGGQA